MLGVEQTTDFTCQVRQTVAHSENLSERTRRWMNHLYARRSTRVRPATGFTYQPEPRTIGLFARGRQLVAGNFLFAGHLVEAPETPLWGLTMPDQRFEEDLHGFTWLDDLAAVGDAAARQRAQSWTFDWIARFGNGRGPGWTPDLTGRRLIRWINHAIFLLNGQESAASEAYFRSLAQQTIFLGRSWRGARPGLARFEALTGLIYAGLALTGMDAHVAPATRALARECEAQIDAEGGIPTRNPEELLEVFTLLIWADSALSGAGRMAPREHLEAIERIAPTLRALRHSDGGLTRCHGGGRGHEGRLDQALASAGVRAGARSGLSMGFARLHAGRTSVIVDAAAPPSGPASYDAHASTLAFEMTSGRRPVVVNCGSGASFGEEWRRAGRATPSHSVLSVENYSSSRLGSGRRAGMLVDIPQHVPMQQTVGLEGVSLHAGHDGYAATHGLTHLRRLDLSADGSRLVGEDTLATDRPMDRAQFDYAMERAGEEGIVYRVRFHLHPDVDVALDMGGNAVSMALKSGEIWVFRHDGAAGLRLESSVYLENGRLKPRATKQIVLTGRIVEYACRVSWSFAKARESLVAIRDLERDEILTPT